MDSGSESESDGGIPVPQLPTNLWGNVHAELANANNDDNDSSEPVYPELNRHRPRNGMARNVESDSDPDTPPGGWSFDPGDPNETPGDTATFSHRAPDPLTTTYNQSGVQNLMETPTEYEKDSRMRTHLREEKHAALCVLMDKELLVNYALAANETIPQTRRRFMAKYLAPNDPERAEDLYAPRVYIAADGNGGEASLVRGRYRDVIGNLEDHGWRKPAQLRRLEIDVKAGSRSGSRSVSVGSNSGANSPRRVSSGVRLTSGSGRSSLGPQVGGEDVDVDEDEDL